ncbi:transposase, partial [Vreelandella rituensis]
SGALWGERFWSRSYCMLSVGDGANTEIIKRYIQNQTRPS